MRASSEFTFQVAILRIGRFYECSLLVNEWCRVFCMLDGIDGGALTSSV
jgi:hypothetical protein